MPTEKQIFTASDGLTFDDRDRAESHERLIEAKDVFEKAKKRYATVLWETQATADGERFDFDRWQYYAVREFCGVPHIVDVSVYRHSCELDDLDRGRLTQLAQESDGTVRRQTWRIDELFTTRRAAEHGLRLALLEHLSSVNKTLSELEKENDDA